MIASTQTNHPLTDASQHESTASPLDQAVARLREAGLRVTQPRIAILNALFKRAQPSSIEQLHNDLSDGSCDLVTVYRCLSAFEEIGLVYRSFFHNGTSVYSLSLGDSNRYHVTNKDTGAINALDAESAAELQAAVQRIEERLRSKGYTSISHVVEFYAEVAGAPKRGQSPVKVV